MPCVRRGSRAAPGATSLSHAGDAARYELRLRVSGPAERAARLSCEAWPRISTVHLEGRRGGSWADWALPAAVGWVLVALDYEYRTLSKYSS